MAKKLRTSFALSEQALALLKQLSEKKGVSQAAILEMAIREQAEKEGLNK